jgi:hypothetical protein
MKSTELIIYLLIMAAALWLVYKYRERGKKL